MQHVLPSSADTKSGISKSKIHLDQVKNCSKKPEHFSLRPDFHLASGPDVARSAKHRASPDAHPPENGKTQAQVLAHVR